MTALAHDNSMPHDIRFDEGTVEGCPPNCPARLAAVMAPDVDQARRTPHAFVPAIDDGAPPEPRDVGKCCGLVRAAFVHETCNHWYTRTNVRCASRAGDHPLDEGSPIHSDGTGQRWTERSPYDAIAPDARVAAPGTCKQVGCKGWGTVDEHVRTRIGAPDTFAPYEVPSTRREVTFTFHRSQRGWAATGHGPAQAVHLEGRDLPDLGKQVVAALNLILNS